jgi:hypothetical protein
MAIGSIHPKDKEAPLCKCGCGQKVRWSRVNKKYKDYANGHNSNTVPKNAKHLFPKMKK